MVVDLAEAVERAADGMTRSQLQRATGLSARTLRDILTGAERRYGRATLDKLDGPLGWKPSTAWDLYKQRPKPASTDARLEQVIAQQMAAMTERIAMLEEAPTWAGEVLDAFRPLRPDDRAILLALARRLGASR